MRNLERNNGGDVSVQSAEESESAPTPWRTVQQEQTGALNPIANVPTHSIDARDEENPASSASLGTEQSSEEQNPRSPTP